MIIRDLILHELRGSPMPNDTASWHELFDARRWDLLHSIGGLVKENVCLTYVPAGMFATAISLRAGAHSQAPRQRLGSCYCAKRCCVPSSWVRQFVCGLNIGNTSNFDYVQRRWHRLNQKQTSYRLQRRIGPRVCLPSCLLPPWLCTGLQQR
jgi:hypothetical protein